MTISLIEKSQVSALDLFAARPAAELRADSPAPEQADNDSPRGFDDLLRDAKPNPSSSDEPREANRRGDGAVNDEADSKRADTDSSRETESAAGADKKKSDETEPDDVDSQDGVEAKQSDGETKGDEGEVTTPTESVESETQSAQALAAQFALTQQGGDPTKTSGNGDEQAKQAQANAAQQAQAALANASAQQAAATKAQATGPQLDTTGLQTAQQVLQQGAQSDTDGGETKGETKSSAQTASSSTTANSNTASNAAAFNLGDRPAGDARLNLNPATNIQQAEGGKQTHAQLMGAQNDNNSLNTARLTRGLANAVQQRGGAVTLRLTPPEMGTVRIQMQITGANVSASFHAETASAQTLLTQQLSQLRTALESQGMNVDKLSVQPLASTSQSQNANQGGNDNNQQQNQAQQQSANDGRSRGQYNSDQGGRASDDSRGDARDNQAPRGFFDQLTDADETAGQAA